MTRKTLKSLMMAVLLLAAPGAALAEGAVVGHFNDCTATGNFFAQGPNGNILILSWANNPGDFRRTNPDGSGWLSLADGNASVTVLSPGFIPIAVGEGSFAVSATALLGPAPCGGFMLDGSHVQLHVTAQATNLATGQPTQLLVEAVVHNGEFKLFQVTGL